MLLVTAIKVVHSMHLSVIYSFRGRLMVLAVRNLLLVDSGGKRSNTQSSYLLQGLADRFRK